MAKDVLIAVPVVGGIDADVCGFLLEAQKRGFDVRIFKDYAPTQYARNIICASFLKTKHKRLWMLDADTIPRNNIWGLLEPNADIISPIYARKRVCIVDGEPRVAYNLMDYEDINDVSTSKPSWPEIGQGVIPIDAVGTGCVIIKRRVLEDPKMLLDTKWTHMDGTPQDDKDEDVKPFFRNVNSAIGKYVGGHDYDFCLRARRLNYQIALHTDIVCGHRKEIDLASTLRLTEFGRGRLPLEMLADMAECEAGGRI